MTITLEQLRMALLWSKDTTFYGYLASTVPAFWSSQEESAACLSKGDNGTNIKILFNPEYMDSLTLAQQKWVYLHEIGHWLNQHFLRRNGRDITKWNRACDLAINEAIEQDSNHMHSDPVRPPPGILFMSTALKAKLSVENRSAEEIYELLPDEPACSSGKGKMKGIKGGCGNAPREPQHGPWKDMDSLPEDYVSAQIADAIDSAAKAAGSMPGTVKVLLEDLLSSKVNWTAILRHILGLGRPNGTIRSWSKLDRRFDDELPGRKKIRRGSIITIIDSSGSITERELLQFRSEIEYQFKLNDVTVIICDSEVHEIVKYKRRMKFTISGRGGTDMNPALEASKSIRANTIVTLTDGYLVDAPIETPARQIWVLTPDGSDALLKNQTVVRMTR